MKMIKPGSITIDKNGIITLDGFFWDGNNCEVSKVIMLDLVKQYICDLIEKEQALLKSLANKEVKR